MQLNLLDQGARSGNGVEKWDRPPTCDTLLPDLRKAAIRRRTAKTVALGTQLLTRKTLGGSRRVINRLRLASELYQQHIAGMAGIIEEEAGQ